MIIFLTYYKYPCKEPALENIFAKGIGRKLDIVWIFQGDNKKEKKRVWHNSRVLLCKNLNGNHFYDRIINKFLACGKYLILFSLIKKRKAKIIVVRDMPLQAILIAPLRIFYEFKLFFQYTAPLGDINIEYYNQNITIKRYWYLISGRIFNFLIKKALKTSDLVFPISEFHKKELNFIISADKLIVISMGIDEDWLTKERMKIPFLQKIKETNFLIIYFGALNFSRNPLFILKMFAKLNTKCQNCKLILVGKTGSYWEEIELRSTAKQMKLDNNIIFAGYINRELLKDYLSYCDVSICPIPPKGHFKISSPTKIYESLGSGIPVVANKEIYEQEKVIKESGGGVLVGYDSNAFADATEYLLRNKGLRKKMSENGKNYVIDNYNYEKICMDIYPYFI
jgi:glycosyltransferase involved in cell wall biosynthesis